MSYHANDETGLNVAFIEKTTRHALIRRKLIWGVYWRGGRAPEYFRYLSDAKAFVERLRHSHKITWTVQEY